MALHVALRRAHRIACVVGYSGRLIAGPALAEEITQKPPVLLIHGTADEVLPIEAMREAKRVLEALGVPLEAHERPGLGHGIDEFGLEAGRRFLARHLKTAA